MLIIVSNVEIESDSEAKGGIFALFYKLKIMSMFGDNNKTVEYFKTISLSILSGVTAGVYVDSSVNLAGTVVYFAVVIILLLIFAWFIEFMQKMNTQSSNEVKKEIIDLLSEEKLTIGEIIDEIAQSPDKVYFNLQQLQEQGKVIEPIEDGRKYARIDDFHTEKETE